MEEIHQAISYLRFPGLARDPRVVHGISLRGRDTGWNMSFSVSSRHGDPRSSRETFLGALGLDPRRCVVAGQVHSASVAVVEKPPTGDFPKDGQQLLPSTDGLLTETPDLALLITAADCPPVFLFDPVRPAIGVVHSGWRGTWRRIVPAAVEAMRGRFGSDPTRLLAAIGPGIASCCYTVGEDLAETLGERDRIHLGRGPGGGGWILDLPGWIFRQLGEAGLPERSIEVSPFCTACNTERFFSHRAEKGDTGRVAAVAALRGRGSFSVR